MCVGATIEQYMREPKPQTPFRTLGNRLKRLRERREQSLNEVAGAVEIDTELLLRIERGEERPAEDVLDLMISHFKLRQRDANRLWESAGYPLDDDDPVDSVGSAPDKATLLVVAFDARATYSDGLVITANRSGLILNFTQSGMITPPLPIARIGVSYEQAEAILQTLQQTLLRQRYLPKSRLLPPGPAA